KTGKPQPSPSASFPLKPFCSAWLDWLKPAGHQLWSDVIVREGRGQLAVGLGLGKQCVGLGLERLHGVCAGSEASWRLLERDEFHEGVRELCRVTTLLPIHALPGSDDAQASASAGDEPNFLFSHDMFLIWTTS